MKSTAKEKLMRLMSHIRFKNNHLSFSRLTAALLILGFCIASFNAYGQDDPTGVTKVEYGMDGVKKGTLEMVDVMEWESTTVGSVKSTKYQEMWRSMDSIYIENEQLQKGFLIEINKADVSEVSTSGFNPIGKIMASSSAPVMSEKSGFVKEDTVYEDVPEIATSDLNNVLNWIKAQTINLRTPYCYRQSNGRGVGSVRSTCAANQDKDGLLCYPKCAPGENGIGPVCWKPCPSGYTDNGLFCGRGADNMSAPSRVADCPSGYTNIGLLCSRGADTYGKGCCCTVFGCCHNCRSGYTDFGCTCTRGVSTLTTSSMTCPGGYFLNTSLGRCYKNCPDGYTNTGEFCYKGPSTVVHESYGRGVGSPMGCPSGTIPDETGGPAGLCYPACKSGFHGVGPVCWQNCTNGLVPCGAGCAVSATECATTTFDMVFSVAVLAANIATLGVAKEGATVAKAGQEVVKVGNKYITTTTKLGKLAAKAVDALQTVSKGQEAVTKITVIKKYAAGALKVYKYSKAAYEAKKDYETAYATEFVEQTSTAINNEINAKFGPKTALYVKQSWGDIQLNELAYTNGITIAQDVLALASIADPTGVLGVVSAFTKPICGDAAPFPALTKSYK